MREGTEKGGEEAGEIWVHPHIAKTPMVFGVGFKSKKTGNGKENISKITHWGGMEKSKPTRIIKNGGTAGIKAGKFKMWSGSMEKCIGATKGGNSNGQLSLTVFKKADHRQINSKQTLTKAI